VKIELTPKDVIMLSDLSEKGCMSVDCLDCPLDDLYCDVRSVPEIMIVAECLLKSGKETNGQ